MCKHAAFLLPLFGLLLSAPVASAQQSAGYNIVVNAANPTSSLTSEQVSRLLLKRETKWQNGQTVLPVDLPYTSPVRERLTRALHGKSVEEMKAYWQQMIFSGRAVPPLEQTSDREVLDYVRANVNAIGYVASDTPVGANIKVLMISAGGG